LIIQSFKIIKEFIKKNDILFFNYIENNMAASQYYSLYDAVDADNLSNVRYYLDLGLNPNIREPGQRGRQSLLSRAAELGNPNMVALLLEYGADPMRDLPGESSLFEAIKSNNSEIVELLLNAGADPNGRYHR
jgi:ankyrin repeat protein